MCFIVHEVHISCRWGELSHGGDTLCAPALCASLVTWFSLHFVVGLDHVSVGGWYHGGYTLCAAALRAEMWLWFVATCCGGCPGHVLVVAAWSNCHYRV